MSDGEPAEVEPEILDELFRAPIEGFVAARAVIAKRLKKEGRADAAARVKSIAKPSITAWVVNQLKYEAGDELHLVLDAGEALRRAHEQGAALPVARDNHRRALVRGLAVAQDIAARAGHALTPALVKRLATNLEALSARGLSARTIVGWLNQDLAAGGFDDLAALSLMAPASPTPTTVRTAAAPPAEQGIAERQRAVEAELQAAQLRVVAAKAALSQAVRRSEEARRRVQSARQALATAEGDEGRATDETRRAEESLAAARAERDLTRARRDALADGDTLP